MAQTRKADVVVADPEPMARSGMIHLIDSHPLLRVCGEAENLPRARELCARHKPRLLVFDPAMGDGFSFLKDLPRWSKGTHVVVFTGLNDALSVQRAFKAGACGYATRREPVSSVIATLLAALEGRRHVGPAISHILLENLACGTVEVRGDEMAALSARELEVFRMIGRGLATRTVAEELHLSVKTIESHRQRIKEKLQLASGTELQRRAVLYTGHDTGGVMAGGAGVSVKAKR